MVDRRFAGDRGFLPRSRWVGTLALAAALVLGIGAGLWAEVQARAPLRALDHHATVLNGRIVGSAFLIGADLALTNAHVVKGLRSGGEVTLLSDGGLRKARARVIAVSSRMDLAILRTPSGFLPVVSGRDAPRVAGLAVLGAGVDASGSRGTGPRMELPGSVVDPQTDLGAFGPGLVVRMPGVRPGFSGGPVLDAEGHLVGMITAIRSSAGAAPAPAGGAHQRPADEAFVLRAAEIRREAERLLRRAGH